MGLRASPDRAAQPGPKLLDRGASACPQAGLHHRHAVIGGTPHIIRLILVHGHGKFCRPRGTPHTLRPACSSEASSSGGIRTSPGLSTPPPRGGLRCRRIELTGTHHVLWPGTMLLRFVIGELCKPSGGFKWPGSMTNAKV